MRIFHKAPIALTLGAALLAGSVAPSLAFGGLGASLQGVSRSDTALPRIQVRGGIRYHQLQTAQDGQESTVWWGQSVDPRARGIVEAEETGRVDGYL